MIVHVNGVLVVRQCCAWLVVAATIACDTSPEVTVYSCLDQGLSTTAQWNGAHAAPTLLFQSGFEDGVRIERESNQ